MASFSSMHKINRVKPMNVEETACLLVLLAGIIAGTGELQLWYVSVKGFLSRLIILLAAYAGGAGLGAVAGALLGIIPGLSFTTVPYLMGAYSFAGVVAGLGRVLGKIGVAISFLAANIILSIYYNNFTGMEAVIAETGLAGVVFCLCRKALPWLFSCSARICRSQARSQ
jgi:stage II sporulation protein E